MVSLGSLQREPPSLPGDRLASPQQPQRLDGVGHRRQRGRTLEPHGVQHHGASRHQGDEGPAPAHLVNGRYRGRGSGWVAGVGVGDGSQADGAGGPGRGAEHRVHVEHEALVGHHAVRVPEFLGQDDGVNEFGRAHGRDYLQT